MPYKTWGSGGYHFVSIAHSISSFQYVCFHRIAKMMVLHEKERAIRNACTMHIKTTCLYPRNLAYLSWKTTEIKTNRFSCVQKFFFSIVSQEYKITKLLFKNTSQILYVWGFLFSSHSIIFTLEWRLHYITVEGLQLLTYTRHSWPLNSEGS